MSVSLSMSGLREFLTHLGEVPEIVERDAREVIDNAAQRLAGIVRGALPNVTGELEGSVRIVDEGRLLRRVLYGGAEGQPAEYGVAFEKGSPPRQTQRGANRGRMPAAFVMRKHAGRVRRAMNRELAGRLNERLRTL